MLKIDINQAAIERMIAVTEATEQQIEKARVSALRKVRTPIRRAVLQAVAKERRIPQKSIESRVYAGAVPDGADSMQIWFGTWNVSLFEAGSPKQTKTGVSVGRLRYPGAFISRIYSAREQVWIRLHSKHYSPELYPTKQRPGDRGLTEAGLRGRFPVVRAAIEIDEIVQKVLQDSAELFRQRFMTIFSQELNYFVNIKGAA